MGTYKKQLNESQESQSKGDTKLTKCQQNLRILQDEKGSLEAKLGQKSIALQSQVDNLKNKNVPLQFLIRLIFLLDGSTAKENARSATLER